MADHKHFHVQQDGQVTIIQLVDLRLFDTLIISELQDELINYLEADRPSQVLVNFDGVTHCSTSVINALLKAKKRVLESGGTLKLCTMTEPIREAYRMLNLDGTVFEIYDSSADAIAAFG